MIISSTSDIYRNPTREDHQTPRAAASQPAKPVGTMLKMPLQRVKVPMKPVKYAAMHPLLTPTPEKTQPRRIIMTPYLHVDREKLLLK